MSLPDYEVEILDDETSVTEITFLPDGRICLFGASREVLQLLMELNLGDSSLNQRFSMIQSTTPSVDLPQQ